MIIITSIYNDKCFKAYVYHQGDDQIINIPKNSYEYLIPL